MTNTGRATTQLLKMNQPNQPTTTLEKDAKRLASIEAKDAKRLASIEAKAAAKIVKDEANAAAKAIKDEEKAAAKIVKDEANAAAKIVKDEEKAAKRLASIEANAAAKVIKDEENSAAKAAAKAAKEAEMAEKENVYKQLRKSTLQERITWATTKPAQIEKKEGTTISQQKLESQENEKKWGNDMIQQTDNGQWTTLLGETLVFDVLEMRGENPKRVVRKEGFEPDWETDDYMYEVKTSNWWVDGTAGEKVYGTFIKYQNIPELYGKPLRIVCVAYQEDELTNGKTTYFGEKITPKTKQLLDMAKEWDIEYIKFSDLANTISL
jgi:hypothetical protein